MSLAFAVFRDKPRLASLLDHFAIIDDWRAPWRVAHPLRDRSPDESWRFKHRV